MKSLFAISFSLLIVFQSAGMGMYDVLLSGRFVKHSKYHSENYGDDFFTFFEKHYGALKAEHQKNHKEEEQEHQELPFQHISCHHASTDVVLVPFEVSIVKVEINARPPHVYYYQNLYSSLEKFSIFQPPKLA